MPLNIVDLLPELLEEIFRHLPKANDRRRLAQVCRTFYRIVRGQSKKFSTLYLTNKVPDKSPVQIFKNSTAFPFSKLHVGYSATEFIKDLDFWLEHGQYITELTINNVFSFHWLTFFPFVKKLDFESFSELLIEENAPEIQLSVEEFRIGYGFNMDYIGYILHCCPSLKVVELSMGSDHCKRCAELLPWIESIETVKVALQEEVQLKEILELPSKLVLQRLRISSNTDVESIASFFNSPRLIEILELDFDPNPYNDSISRFTKNMILPLLKAELIKQLVVKSIPEFPGCLDLLAQVPGLQEINIFFNERIRFFPSYWSSPNTASKINNIVFHSLFYPEVLAGLNSLSSLTIGISNGNLEVVRNHPKLKTFVINSFVMDDAELDPISFLNELEILEFNEALNVTSAAFKTIIRFPKLKKLMIRCGEMKNDVAMLLPENCPNLEVLWLQRISFDDDTKQKGTIIDLFNDAGFEYLIRALPYLKHIQIHGKHLISQEKVEQMKTEFPYLKINVKN